MAMQTLTLVYDDEHGSIPDVKAVFDGINNRLAALEDATGCCDLGPLTDSVAALESRLAVLESRSAAVADILDGDGEQ